MRNYLKYLVYYFLSLVDAVINFSCSIFGFYPGIEKSTDFLVSVELYRADKTISTRTQEREEQAQEAKKDIDSARSMLEKDI